MISREEALALAEAAFPRGPEVLAERLGIPVVHTPLVGCDGWCIRSGNRVVIRINSATGEARQRFTLAHELAHVVQGTVPDLRTGSLSPLHSDGPEEADANNLASELLLPQSVVADVIKPPIVDAVALRSLARRAHVSELMAAYRVVGLSRALSLPNAGIFGFREEATYWAFVQDVRYLKTDPPKALKAAQKTHPKPARIPTRSGKVVMASSVGSPDFPAVLVQILPAEATEKPLPGEEIHDLAEWLFDGDVSFRATVNGCLSSLKQRLAPGTPLEDAMLAFEVRYRDRWKGEQERKIWSDRGRRYLSRRLASWFRH